MTPLAWIRRAFALAIVLSLVAPLAALAADRVYVEWSVNGLTREPVLVVFRNDDVLVERGDLTAAEIPLDRHTGERIFDHEYLSLTSLSEILTYVLDRKTLELRVSLKARALQRRSADLGSVEPTDVSVAATRSLVLNYGVHDDSVAGFSGSLEARVNLARGVLFDASAVKDEGATLRRGIANLTFDVPAHLRRTIIGDTIAGGADLGGGALLGGVTVRRQFDENPYVITYPLPSLQATVLQPTRADFFVNGVLVKSIELAPGTYDLNNLPLRSGISHAQVELHSAGGTQLLLDSVLYGSAGLLRKGLTDYSYSAGAVRNDVESAGDSYGERAVSGRYRLGLTNQSTLGAHVESTPHLADAGIEYDGALARGDVHTAVASSNNGGIAGMAATAGYFSAGISGGFSILARIQTAHFSTLSLRAADDRALSQFAVSAARGLPGRISASFSLQATQYRDSGNVQTAVIALQRYVHDFNGILSYTANRRSATGGALASSVQFSLGRAIGRSGYASVTSQADDTSRTTLQIQRSATSPLDTQYSLALSNNPYAPVGGNLQTGFAFATIGAAVNGTGNGRYTEALNLSGSIVRVGAVTLFSQPIPDAYAIVEAPGMGGANVTLNNQIVARTNRAGYAVVPGLGSYLPSIVGISDVNLPFDELVGGDQRIAPGFKGAGIVRYASHREHGIVGSAQVRRTGRGEPAAYGQIELRLGKVIQTSPTDADGRFYFEHLATGVYEATISDTYGVRCTAQVRIPEFSGAQFSLGTVTCVE